MVQTPEEQPERRMIQQAVELRTPDGVMRGQVAVDTGPMRLAELVPTACELTNVLLTRAEAREKKASRVISCRAGCGACCRQMVPLSPPEVFYLADLVDSLPPQNGSIIRQRFDAIVGVLEEKEFVDELLDPDHTDEPVMAIAREYFGLGLACPFLVDESCSIHPYRPVACREYNVTSPAEWCAEPYSHEIAKVPMPLPLSAPLARLTAELMGTGPQLIPLTLALRWAADHPELRAKSWPGPELFGRFMAQLGPSSASPGPHSSDAPSSP